MSTMLDYWVECIAQSCLDHGVTATAEQIALIAEDVKVWGECRELACGVPENPLIREVEEAKRALDVERSKVHCRTCNGTGRTHTYGGTMMSDSPCWKCRGEGKHLP